MWPTVEPVGVRGRTAYGQGDRIHYKALEKTSGGDMPLPETVGRPEPSAGETEATGRRVLDLLTQRGRELTVAEITAGTGQHANTVRSHLALLVEMGRVEVVPENRTRPGRPKLLYRASQATEPADPYRALAAELAAAAGDTAHSPGEAAGHRLARAQRDKVAPDAEAIAPEASIEMAVDGLEVLGFETTTDPLGDRLYLSACPFADLARRDHAICRLHHEMLHGFFDELDSGVTVRRLDIFIKDDLCVAHLNRPDLRPAPAPQAASDSPNQWEQ
jgi:predicted ArsR family transcriptional regulator